MKAIIICPAERPEVSALAEEAPLASLCILGKPFIYYWLEHLAKLGAKEIQILAADRPEQVRKTVGDGARWGLHIETLSESRELTCDEAREKYCESQRAEWLTNGITLIDHLPGLPEERLFESYAQYFSAIQFWLSKNPSPTQIGVKEIQPGIWVGIRTQISPQAKLTSPCWIGENVLVKPDAEIGPMAILENGTVVENAAAISQSWVGRQTFVGSLTQVKDSLAFGNTLVNFRTDSVARIPDAFLLCALKDRNLLNSSGHLFGRMAALLTILFTLPFALITILKTRLQGNRAFRPRRAAAPQMATHNSIIYSEFANASGWWRRWPQLWNIVRGDFTWIGNRPLTLIEAGKLTNEFERLWLAAPIGLISQGDAEGCTDTFSDEARAHASFYAAQANWRLDCLILVRAAARLVGKKLTEPPPSEGDGFKTRPVELDHSIIR